MNRILTSLIVVLATANLSAQQMADLPKLVVGITVDQLRGDYLQYLYNAFGEKGFKRLIENGILYENVNFDIENADKSSSMATVFTGAYPFHHGIISGTIFNPSTLRVESVFNDIAYMGNYTSQSVSPRKLRTSTITDELKSASGGLSRVYSIAPDMEQALIGAGHSADGAFWIENNSGKWATTTFYKDIPYFVEKFNRNEAVDNRINDLVWEPVLNASDYNFIPYSENEWSFKHVFSKIKKDQLKIFKTSALVNDEVNRFAKLFIENSSFGQKKNPDFLSITYNAGGYSEGNQLNYSVETQDTYLRLDKSLGELLDVIEKNVGLNNTFIFLTSTGNYVNNNQPAEKLNIPTGEFHPERCTALLNTYLMALFGQENWVLGYNNEQIYLNHRAIDNNKIDLKDIQTKAAEFIVQFSGVQDVVTSHQLLHGNWNEHNNRFRNGYNPSVSGDLILTVQPGWNIVFENELKKRTIVRRDAVPAPLILYNPKFKKESITRPVDAVYIAPTVSRVLRIRAPNACSAMPLPEIK